MQKLIDDYIEMNTNGRTLELCEKYYAENILMLNNGTVFATSMKESYDKQKSFVDSVKEFNVSLLSSKIQGNVSELVFCYKMIGADSQENIFKGKHIQTWENGKIIKEEYLSVE